MPKPVAARRRRRRFTGIVLPLSVLLGSALVWGSSESAYTATTTTGTNSWATGSISLTNDQSGNAVFSGLTNLQPDTTLSALSPPATGQFTASTAANGGSHCIRVRYTGSVTAKIRLRVALTPATGGLAPYLLFTVDKGTDSTVYPTADVNCANYTSTSYVYGSSGTTTDLLSAFPTTYAGAGPTAEWSVAGTTTDQWYRISWLLPSTATNSSGLQTDAVFTWEAQSS